jgi:hypothetical protein
MKNWASMRLIGAPSSEGNSVAYLFGKAAWAFTFFLSYFLPGSTIKVEDGIPFFPEEKRPFHAYISTW